MGSRYLYLYPQSTMKVLCLVLLVAVAAQAENCQVYKNGIESIFSKMPVAKSASDPNDGVCEDGEGWGCIAEIATTVMDCIAEIGLEDTFLEVATELKIKGLTSPPGSPVKDQKSSEVPRRTYSFERANPKKEPEAMPTLMKRHINDCKESPMVKVKKEYEVQVIDDEPTGEASFPEEDFANQNEFDSSISGEIPYDYNQEGVSYHQEDSRTFSSNQMDYTAASEVKRLTDQYLQRIEVNGCVVWTCTKCGKQGKMKHHVREHIESNHIDCLTFSCPYCNKEMKNRVAMRSHISKNHREENLRSKGLVV